MSAPFDGMIETTSGPTFTHTRGNGPPLLVFHGGPGFDHVPLLAGLTGLLEHRTLIFFNQLGCGRTPATDAPVTAQATFDHAAALLDAVGSEPIGMAAFSWGAVVAAAALARRPDFAFTESLLVSPTPIEGNAYAQARATFVARVPAEIMTELMTMVQAGKEGAEAFALLGPYYVASQQTVLPQMPISVPVYFSVDGSLAEFNFQDAIGRFGAISIIRGDHDHTDQSLIRPLLDAATHDLILEGVGHHPFFEEPGSFAAAARRVLTNHHGQPR